MSLSNPFSKIRIIKTPKVEFYQDKKQPPNKEWWWRLWYSSDIVAASSEGYKNESEAKENFKKIEEHIRYLRENNKI